MNKKLIILYGGPSSEREVSFATKDFFKELYIEFDPLLVEWTLDNRFSVSHNTLTESEFLEYARDEKYNVLIASHGEYVEDGYIQAKLESYGIPFTGSDANSCKLSMDKTKAQNTVSEIVNIIPTYETFKDLSFPFIAKPNSLGSSVGIYLVRDKDSLKNIENRLNNEYIFQPLIRGMEVSLGCVRNGDEFLKLYPTEICPKSEFFDYDAKYVEGMSEEITPARLSEEITNKLITITNKIHNKLGLGYYSRSDFIIDAENTIFYLETNALPGMTKTSLVPQQLRYSNCMNEFKVGLLENMIY